MYRGTFRLFLVMLLVLMFAAFAYASAPVDDTLPLDMPVTINDVADNFTPVVLEVALLSYSIETEAGIEVRYDAEIYSLHVQPGLYVTNYTMSPEVFLSGYYSTAVCSTYTYNDDSEQKRRPDLN